MSKSLGILLGGDILIALVVTHFGMLVRYDLFAGAVLPTEPVKIAAFAGVLVLSGFFLELYDGERPFQARKDGVRIVASLLVAFLILSGLYLLRPRLGFGWEGLVVSLVLFGAIQFLWHHRFSLLMRARGIARPVLILGTGPLARELAEAISGSDRGYLFSGFIASGEEEHPRGANEVVGTLATLAEATQRLKIRTIVVSLTQRRGVMPVRDILGCKLRGIEVVDAMTFYEAITGKLKVEEIHPSWFIFSRGFRLTPPMRALKRSVDVLLALFGLLLTLPLLPLLALLIRIDSPGPVFFRQLRIGERDRPFQVLKFRTMCDGAETGRGAVWAARNDPRVTRLGRFLRKARIDELPQLVNVLKGEMSFVGPRPERPEFVRQLSENIPYYASRHCVRPGLTGWAQVRYPYGASEEDALEKLRYDLYYIKNYSPFLDLVIFFETFKVVLCGRGAR